MPGDRPGWKERWELCSVSPLGSHPPVFFRLPQGVNTIVRLFSLFPAQRRGTHEYILEGTTRAYVTG